MNLFVPTSKRFLAVWIWVMITSASSWAMLNPKDRPYLYRSDFGVGYNLNITELPGTASLVHGPFVSYKFMIENNGVFLAPDASGGILLGLEKSLALTYSLGVGLGVLGDDFTGFWGGLKFMNIHDYKTNTGPVFRAGMFFETETKHRIDLEITYGNMPVDTPTSLLQYSVFGASLTYGLF